MATLVELGTSRVYQLRERTSIGRDQRCDICIADPLVSASHAEIVHDATGAYRLRDLGSRRGTFLGAARITEAELHDGDELLIGPTRLRFDAKAVVAAAAAAPPATASSGEIDELTRLRAIAQLSRKIGVEHDLRTVLGRVLDTCFQLLAADRGAIAVFQPQSKTPHLTLARQRNGDESQFALSTTVVSVVMETHEPHLSTEIDSDAVLQRSASLSINSVRSLMAVPLLYRAEGVELLGVVQLDSRAANGVFLPRDLELLSVIAGQAAFAIKNAMLVRQIRTAVDEEWRHLERVVGNLPAGVIVLDRHGHCRVANHWVVSRAPLIGAMERGTLVTAIAGIARERLCGVDQRLQVWVNLRALEIVTKTSSDDGETVIVISDNTDELEQLTQAAHHDRLSLVGQLAGGIAHDFNNLLALILTYANTLAQSITAPAARADIQMIAHAATSASQLTRQLLMFSHREVVAPQVVDPAALVQNLDRLLRLMLRERVELIIEIDGDVPRVLIDGAQLEQIVVNLVLNARDTIADSGRIELRLSRRRLADRTVAQLPAGGYALLEVEDTGSGMTPEVQARIFEPYFATHKLHPGRGLGFAAMHAIVSQARGHIAITSAVGRGTTFRIYLPETERPLELEPATRSTATSAGGTVLLVDDDDDVRRTIERMLVLAGYTVVTATSGPDALARARGLPRKIDLLLTDLVMPGMTGQELARELTIEHPRLEVVFMSGYPQGGTIDPRRFLAKPFERDVLVGMVAGIFANRPVADAPR
jgi:signal transduction histidine kinase/CheY-like chemotaxis protein